MSGTGREKREKAGNQNQNNFSWKDMIFFCLFLTFLVQLFLRFLIAGQPSVQYSNINTFLISRQIARRGGRNLRQEVGAGEWLGSLSIIDARLWRAIAATQTNDSKAAFASLLRQSHSSAPPLLAINVGVGSRVGE